MNTINRAILPTLMASSANEGKRPVILVGVTGDAEKTACVKACFEKRVEGVTILPQMPHRRSVQSCATWLVDYLLRERSLAKMFKICFLNYISDRKLSAQSSSIHKETFLIGRVAAVGIWGRFFPKSRKRQEDDG